MSKQTMLLLFVFGIALGICDLTWPEIVALSTIFGLGLALTAEKPL